MHDGGGGDIFCIGGCREVIKRRCPSLLRSAASDERDRTPDAPMWLITGEKGACAGETGRAVQYVYVNGASWDSSNSSLTGMTYLGHETGVGTFVRSLCQKARMEMATKMRRRPYVLLRRPDVSTHRRLSPMSLSPYHSSLHSTVSAN
jgi:hypothetical protein